MTGNDTQPTPPVVDFDVPLVSPPAPPPAAEPPAARFPAASSLPSAATTEVSQTPRSWLCPALTPPQPARPGSPPQRAESDRRFGTHVAVVDSPGAWRQWAAATPDEHSRTPPAAPESEPAPAAAIAPDAPRRVLGLATLVAATIIVPVVAVLLTRSTHPARTATPAVASPVVCDHGVGSTGSGPEAIRAFQHAYYTARSGVAAREAVTSTAAVPDAAGIQAGIDATPIGTGYCLHITALQVTSAGGSWRVVITQTTPAHHTAIYQETVYATTSSGRWTITAITPA